MCPLAKEGKESYKEERRSVSVTLNVVDSPGFQLFVTRVIVRGNAVVLDSAAW